VGELHAAALRVVAADVRSELACWATIDPESLVISGMTGGDTLFRRSTSRCLPRLSTRGTSRTH
jgi:hypothetical protein